MRGDRNIRDYYITPKVVSTPLGKEPATLTEFINRVSEKTNYTFYSFESKTFDSINTNILNDYLAYILDKKECFSLFKFDPSAARHFEYKSRSIAKYLYGDTRLFYFIFVFNDIQHDSDLSYDYLINHGLKMPNISGLELLKSLNVFKARVETVSGNRSFLASDF